VSDCEELVGLLKSEVGRYPTRKISLPWKTSRL